MKVRLGRYLISLAGILAVALVGALLFAWSGIYNVSASRGHWAITEWFLAFALRNSIETHSTFVENPPPLDDPNRIILGAGHFHSGCAPCHGAPGMPQNPIALAMLPEPPDLTTAAPRWSDRELFWIVLNGLKYTGMPSWPSRERDDEVWAMVAFLRELPGLDAAAYNDLAFGSLSAAPSGAVHARTDEGTVNLAETCARCHGAEASGPASRLVPVLHGQSADYLFATLEAYETGARQSGFMQPIASGLDDRAKRRLAEYYSTLERPSVGDREFDGLAVERGRVIATEGVPREGIPPCLSCHGSGAWANYPRLAGQNAAYVTRRLRHWQEGINTRTLASQIMAPIARRLDETQIRDVSEYFSSLANRPSGSGDP